jgi:hypothetical protein
MTAGQYDIHAQVEADAADAIDAVGTGDMTARITGGITAGREQLKQLEYRHSHRPGVEQG